MKITCDYCSNLFDDTHATCPHCGAPNPGVVRKSGNQPTTIEELKQWYKDRGLPPAETTRFFIGVDYKKPRAFGIYKDPKTGNFIVYKNKDSGQRAIRYEGTDEAYAVNELFQRLKEEIIQQKRAALDKKAGGSTRSTPSGKSSPSSKPSGKAPVKPSSYQSRPTPAATYQSRPTPATTYKKRRGPLRLLQVLHHWHPNSFIGLAAKGILYLIIGFIILFIILVIIGTIVILVEDQPSEGYYTYRDTSYYYYVNDDTSSDHGWVAYDEQLAAWEDDYIHDYLVPDDLKKNKNAKNFYIQNYWDEYLGVTDFEDSIFYQDHLRKQKVDTGYYYYDDTNYYHNDDYGYAGWYYYNTADADWAPVDEADIPYDLQHGSLAEDFYYTPEWDSSTQITDFADSDYYYDSSSESYSSSSSSSSSDSFWDNWGDDDDYDWDDDDSWTDWGDDDWDTDWGTDWGDDW